MDTLIESINKAMRKNDAALFGKEPKKSLYKTTDEKKNTCICYHIIECINKTNQVSRNITQKTSRKNYSWCER